MANKSNVIDLNGTWFDALTGAQVEQPTQPQASASQPTGVPLGHGLNIIQHVPVQAAPNPANAVRNNGILGQQAVPAGSVDGFVRAPRSAQHIAAHKPQAATTLMRRTARPAASSANSTAPQQPGGTTIQGQASLQPRQVASPTTLQAKLASSAVNPQRALRAQDANRSQAVQHFKPSAPQLQAMRPAPQATVSGADVINPQTFQARPSQQFAASQAVRPRSTGDMVAARRTPQPQFASRPNVQGFQAPRRAPATVNASPAQSQPNQDIFEAALAHAASHEETAPQASRRKSKGKRRALAIAGSVAVFAALAGVIAYQNKANIQYQIASARAGFAASMPNYKPAGYDLGKLQYTSGTVAALYQNKGQANDSISIVQKKSNWDSQTLLDSFVVNAGKDYQGYEANGRTVYVYGNQDATWVNGGIWYQVHSAQAIEPQQLVKIAANL